MVLFIDNYDSFTYNLVALFQRETPVQVFRNDAITIAEIEAMAPRGIVISPGPGRPADSGICPAVVKRFAGEIPILGICLGHQLIGEIMGAQVVEASYPMHGKTSPIDHDASGIFAGLPSPLEVMRYHSLVIDPGSQPDEMLVSARTPAGEIMGIRHKYFNLVGLQFHPESILSEGGLCLVRNWLHALSESSPLTPVVPGKR